MFHFSGELFSTKSIHLCPTNSNLIIVYYFFLALRKAGVITCSQGTEVEKKINFFFSYSNFPSQSRTTKGILSFLLSYKGQRHRKNILQRLGQLFSQLRRKPLSSCFCEKSFDKEIILEKLLPEGRILPICWWLAVRDIRK